MRRTRSDSFESPVTPKRPDSPFVRCAEESRLLLEVPAALLPSVEALKRLFDDFETNEDLLLTSTLPGEVIDGRLLLPIFSPFASILPSFTTRAYIEVTDEGVLVLMRFNAFRLENAFNAYDAALVAQLYTFQINIVRAVMRFIFKEEKKEVPKVKDLNTQQCVPFVMVHRLTMSEDELVEYLGFPTSILVYSSLELVSIDVEDDSFVIRGLGRVLPEAVVLRFSQSRFSFGLVQAIAKQICASGPKEKYLVQPNPLSTLLEVDAVTAEMCELSIEQMKRVAGEQMRRFCLLHSFRKRLPSLSQFCQIALDSERLVWFRVLEIAVDGDMLLERAPETIISTKGRDIVGLAAECSELWPGVFGTLQLYLTHTALRVLSQSESEEK